MIGGSSRILRLIVPTPRRIRTVCVGILSPHLSSSSRVYLLYVSHFRRFFSVELSERHGGFPDGHAGSRAQKSAVALAGGPTDG